MDRDNENRRGGEVPVGEGAGRTLKGGRQKNDTAWEIVSNKETKSYNQGT